MKTILRRLDLSLQREPQIWRPGYAVDSVDSLSVPAGWALKSAGSAGVRTTLQSTRQGKVCLKMFTTDATSTWIRLLTTTTPPQDTYDPGMYKYGILQKTHLNYSAAGGYGMKTGHRYKLVFNLLEVVTGGISFERNADGVTPTTTWTTAGWKTLEFVCGADKAITFIRSGNPCEVYFTEVSLYYLGPG